MILPHIFYLWNFAKTRNWKLKIWPKKSEFEGFAVARFVYLGFHCVARHIEWWFKICHLFLGFSQIWLNLPRNDPHFFNIWQWMIAILGYKQKTPKKNTWIDERWVLVTRGRVGVLTDGQSKADEGAGESSREVWGSEVKWSNRSCVWVRDNNNLIQEWS